MRPFRMRKTARASCRHSPSNVFVFNFWLHLFFSFAVHSNFIAVRDNGE